MLHESDDFRVASISCLEKNYKKLASDLFNPCNSTRLAYEKIQKNLSKVINKKKLHTHFHHLYQLATKGSKIYLQLHNLLTKIKNAKTHKHNLIQVKCFNGTGPLLRYRSAICLTSP